MTEPIKGHRVHWYLVRPEDGETPTAGAPEGHIFCDAPADAPCKQAGPWEEELDLGGKPLSQDECWATVWIEATGIWHLWMGRGTRAVDEGVKAAAWWDGGDWVWAYEGECAVLPDGELVVVY